jgi:hypothetical protein
VTERALVGVGLLALATGDGAAADDLPAVEERFALRVVELRRGAADQVAIAVERGENPRAHIFVDLAGGLEGARREQVRLHRVGVERGLLPLVVRGDELFERAGERAGRDLRGVVGDDRRAVAIGAGDEGDVLGADAVAQEAGEGVGMNEHAADVAEVQVLIPVRHAAGDDGALRKRGPRAFGEEAWSGGLSHAVACELNGQDHRMERIDRMNA